jgi:hypothetical protein
MKDKIIKNDRDGQITLSYKDDRIELYTSFQGSDGLHMAEINISGNNEFDTLLRILESYGIKIDDTYEEELLEYLYPE